MNRFQNFTGQSNVLKAQPTVDITGPATLSVCFAARPLIDEQVVDTFSFRPESLDLCRLYLRCRIQPSFRYLHVMKVLLQFVHVFVGVVDGRGELIPFKEDRGNGLKVDLAPIGRPLH